MATRQGICGAKTRRGGRCKQRPMKNGRCYLHGGKSTGPPKGSQNALKTGEHASILTETLSEEERDLFDRVPAADQAALIDEELRLITLREHRMLQLIAGYREQIGELLIVSEETRKGYGPEGPVDVTAVKKEATETSLLRTEEALTRVQAQKARLIEQLRKINEGGGGDEVAKMVEFYIVE